MCDALSKFDLRSDQSLSLQRLCEGGARYGMETLEEALSPEVRRHLSGRARRRLKNDLRRTLARITRPCFALQSKAFHFAFEALHRHETASLTKIPEARFTGTKLSDRLFSMFQKFPVLARLWSQLICQWRDHITDAFARLAQDRGAISRTFFSGRSTSKIIDLRCSLSDPHKRGRTVMRLRFESGSIIYKPRPGNGEGDWHKFICWINAQSFQPKLRGARVLPRECYCWMQWVEPAACKNQAAARRFYRRLGGMIAAACILRAVDCHRDNLIASGEYPVLVDAETLWHTSFGGNAKTPTEALCETGFLAKSDRRSSWEYRSSVLAETSPGGHTPRIGSKPLRAQRYHTEIISGFRKAWSSILGTAGRRAAVVRRVQRLCERERRWIYWSTRNYDAIRRASVQPDALRSGIERDLLIARLCHRKGVSSAIIRGETDALKRLDIPYFARRITGPISHDRVAQRDAIAALHVLLRF
jgi:lantibiotic modifying enzyme